MQKLIAILFFLLLGSTTLAHGMHLHVNAVEQTADMDKCKEAQADKKDGKEYEAFYAAWQQQAAPAMPQFIINLFFWLPRPALEKPTPPPNCIC